MIKGKPLQGFSTILVVLIAVIVLAGAGVYFLMRRPTPPSMNPSNSASRTPSSNIHEAVPTGELTSTIQDVVGRGADMECDWHMPSSVGPNNPFGTGKLYTTANKGRSMISANSSGVQIDGNAIYKEGEVYSWVTVGSTTAGFKFTRERLNELNSSMTPQQRQQAEQIRAQMIFQCRPWTPDESKFVLPTGVNFQ